MASLDVASPKPDVDCAWVAWHVALVLFGATQYGKRQKPGDECGQSHSSHAISSCNSAVRSVHRRARVNKQGGQQMQSQAYPQCSSFADHGCGSYGAAEATVPLARRGPQEQFADADGVDGFDPSTPAEDGEANPVGFRQGNAFP